MCGIAGTIVPKNTEVSSKYLKRMQFAIEHRGPNASGLWVSDDRSVGFVHQRLSIIDLSEDGAQPMHSASGRYTITYNGEIYNFNDLRKTLIQLGYQFRSYSDTEVILAGFEIWGLLATLERLSGMFAFAVWDRKERSLLIARDRIGIKPLYYSAINGGFVFASELRALVSYWNSLPEISAFALNEYLRLGYVPAPLAIFEGTHKLLPGHYAVYRNGYLSAPEAYWKFDTIVREGLNNPIENKNTAIKSLDEQLRTSVKNHMVSDVPLGAFLSGGVDSSTVVALMQSISAKPVKTFSIGFHAQGYNEAEYAARIAKHLGTEHHELYVTEQDAQNVIPDIPDIYDEPFADASQIPTFLLSKLACEHVTVSLSGDGGDELFAGYNRYRFVANFWRKLQKLPLPLRRNMAKLLQIPSVTSWDVLFNSLHSGLPAKFIPALPGQKMHKAASVLSASNLVELHNRLVSQWATPKTILHDSWIYRMNTMPSEHCYLENLSDIEQQMFWDTQSYLVDDILVKLDRASMRVGLEARVPLLDHDVLAFAWRVPISMKMTEDGGKWLLRQVLYQYVPRSLIDRPKMGFSVPIDDWLRGALKDWALSNLSESKLDHFGIFNSKQINYVLTQHLNKKLNAGGALWTLLMFQLWFEKTKNWL